MCFNNLDIIYHIISDSKYDQLKNFDSNVFYTFEHLKRRLLLKLYLDFF